MATTSTERVRAMRERRRTAIEADPDTHLRSADELIAPAIAETIGALDLGPEHAAAVRLAERYAAAIDAAKDPAWAARWLGPLLLDALGALGATPMSRPKAQESPARGPNRLEQLRSVRRQNFPGA